MPVGDDDNDGGDDDVILEVGQTRQSDKYVFQSSLSNRIKALRERFDMH